MMTQFVKVVNVGPLTEVQLKTGETPIKKRELVVADGYDEFRVTCLREDAELNYEVGDIASMSLSFRVREYEGRFFQDITARYAVILTPKLNF